jgi:hydroxymethylpyrimidine pyrophosphatase-like HAD family hydrolase
MIDFEAEAIYHLYNMMGVFSFDFDGTLNNSYYTNDKFVEDLTPKQEMVDLLKKLKENDYIVYIVTSRRIDRMKAVHDFVSQHELNVDGVMTTNENLKASILKSLGVQVHFDDSMEEVKNNLIQGIKTYHVKSKI